MAIVVLMLALAAAAWGALFARRASLWFASAVFIAAGYVLGPPLWTAHLGPVALTIDRVLLIALATMGVWQWRRGRLNLAVMTGYDWLLVAALAYMTLRCVMTDPPPADSASVKPWWKLAAAYWVPAALYLAGRVAPRSERSWRMTLGVLAGLGLFLACTAYAEVGKQWWAVFPRYISNPELGTHFGRARGPALNSASLGVFLSICFWAAWMLIPRAGRALQIALLAVLLVVAGAVYFTYTRSTWLGMAIGLAVIPVLQMPRRWRLPAAMGVAMCGALGVGLLGGRVADLSRKDSDASAEHSVYQRASFVYVSMRMFRDRPIFGCGLGRFYDMKVPYLADRHQQLELDSLRNLDHHNTLLGILTETGFVGFALFTALLAGWMRAAWRLARDGNCEPWQRTHGLFALATTLSYLASALFHDLTLSPTEHWLLFFITGAAVGLLADARAPIRALAPVPPGSTSLLDRIPAATRLPTPRPSLP
jgi:O-antigen ligase